MGKAAGNKELTLVLLAQLHADVLAECRRRTAQVDRDIQYLAFYDTYQFGLTVFAFLIMQSA